MTIDEAIKELEEEGVMLGAGDYIDLEALKVAIDIMRDYQRIVHKDVEVITANKRKEMIDYFYDMNVRSDIKIEALVDDIISMIEN